MKIALFGSTGMAGKAVLRKALERGHEVTLLLRSRASTAALGANVRVVIGDALDTVAVGQALQGVEAIIQTLGVGGMGDGRPNDLVADATRIILDQMQQQEISRIICASNIGVPGSGAFVFSKILVPIAARKLIPILHAKVRMEAILQASTAQWTAVRLAALNEKPDRKKLRISAEGITQGYTITTGDAADFMLDILEKRQHLRRAVAISN
jgi:putative NADH-flavin reductase